MTDPTARLNAALSDRYRIERELGQGGMATVYLAVDLKHEREVALKVLKPELAAVVGAERFLAEIKTTAALQHPNILPLHDSGEADSFLFYVMPYVAGESLRDRLDREHQLPVEDAVQIAKSLAEALEYAHSKGVIHRDIKPANILLQAGKPVIADFGIALAVGVAGGGRLTETGLSVGTPHYMSPEQATGDQSVGVSTDIYALGCVLYEMLVGEPPYTGVTAQAILGKIIAGEFAAASQERASVPPNVDAAIQAALEKLPADRFRSAQDFARALADPGFRHGLAGTEVARSQTTKWTPLAIGFGASTLALALVTGWLLVRPEAEMPQPVQRFTLDFQTVGMPGLTPDGSAVVYEGGVGPESRLFIRRWEDLDPVPIPGTDGDRLGNGTFPTVSPTGQEVAFSLNGELKVAPISGGLVRTLTDSAGLRPRWGRDGFIYFSRPDGTIHRVLANGESEPEIVSRRNTEDDGPHEYFEVLPGGEFGLATVFANPTRIEGVRIETGERTVITSGSTPYFTSTGHLVFGAPGGDLLAAPFDVATMELSGQPVTLLQGLSVGANNSPRFTLSEAGTLVYSVGENRISEFVWVTRSGQATPVDPTHQFVLPTNHGIRISPDETRVAFTGRVDLNDDIRIKHLPTGPDERLTFSPDLDYRPMWTPDGVHLTYFSGPSGDDRNVWSVRADGTGQPVLLLDDVRSLNQGSWSPDGQWLVARSAATAEMGLGQRDILSFRPGTDTAAVPLVASPDFVEGAPEISPDGRWLAYTSNRTGREEVFVRPFPNTDSTRIAVSGAGGMSPVWAKSGRELFFVDQARGLVAAEFDPETGRVLAQETLFTLSDAYEAQGSNSFYDVSADGERFLMVRSYGGEDGGASRPRFILVQNFLEVLKERMGGN